MHPDQGEIWIDDIEITRLRGRALDEVRHRFGMLFQGGALFDSMNQIPDRPWGSLPCGRMK